MSRIGCKKAKSRFRKLLKQVAMGKDFIITRHGVAIALLTQPPEEEERRIRQVVEEMLAYRDREKLTLGGLTVRQMIEEGRRF